jgi:integrase
MAHVQRRCSTCGGYVRGRVRACPGCGGNARISWVARWIDAEGVERSQSFARRPDAERHLANVETAKATGSYVDPRRGRRPLAEIVEGWYASAAPSLKPKTRASYRGLIDVRILPYLGRRQVASLAPSDIQRWVNELTAEGLSSSRIRQAHIVLGMALDAAVHDGIVARNPARRSGVRLPKLERRQPVFLEPEVTERIAAACPQPYDLLVRLLSTSGLRWGEAVALRRRSVDLLGRRLLISESLAEVGGELTFGSTKSHAERVVPLTASVAAALEAHIDNRVRSDPRALVFMSPKGHALRYANFRREVWAPAPRAAKGAEGRPARPSALGCLRDDPSRRVAESPSTILGYQSAGFTLSVYGHVFEQDVAALAERLETVMTASRSEDETRSRDLRVV